MPRPPIRVQRPEGGDELDVCFYLHHNCPQAVALKRAGMDEDLDLLQFTVGLQGQGIPLDTPFVVYASNPCEGCGKYLQHWFEWGGQRVIAPKGALWTP